MGALTGRRSAKDLEALARLTDGAEAKVDELDVLVVGKEDVFELDVSVRDSEHVQVLDGLEDLEKDAARLVFRKAPLGLDVRAQVAPVEALHDEVHALGRLHGLVHARNARVADLLHNLDLAVHALPVRRVFELGFVVSLDGHFGARQAVPGRAHLAVAAHAHDFAHHVHVHDGRGRGHDAAAAALAHQQQLLELEGVARAAKLVGHSGEPHVDELLWQRLHAAGANVHRRAAQLEALRGRGGGHFWVRAAVKRLAVHLVVVVAVQNLALAVAVVVEASLVSALAARAAHGRGAVLHRPHHCRVLVGVVNGRADSCSGRRGALGRGGDVRRRRRHACHAAAAAAAALSARCRLAAAAAAAADARDSPRPCRRAPTHARPLPLPLHEARGLRARGEAVVQLVGRAPVVVGRRCGPRARSRRKVVAARAAPVGRRRRRCCCCG